MHTFLVLSTHLATLIGFCSINLVTAPGFLTKVKDVRSNFFAAGFNTFDASSIICLAAGSSSDAAGSISESV